MENPETKLESELPPEIYAQILEEVKEPETYSAMAKTSRSLRELALEKQSLSRAKERFFHGIDPYLYQKAKEIVVDWTPIGYQCDEVNRFKTQQIAQDLEIHLKNGKVEKNTQGFLPGVFLEDLIYYIQKDIIMILLGVRLTGKIKLNNYGKFNKGIDSIIEAYNKSFRKIILEILEYYDLYDPFQEHGEGPAFG